MAQYARREGFDAQAAYRWRHLSGLRGRRVDAKFVESSKALRIAKLRACAVFARVAVSDAGVALRALVLRLILNNGRRAELEIDGAAHLGEVRPPADEDLHDLMAERYERLSTIVNSNLDFGEWISHSRSALALTTRLALTAVGAATQA